MGRIWPDPTPAGGSLPNGNPGRKPPPPPPRRGRKECCPMVAAFRSARRGNKRLARRYAIMSVRLTVARII